MTGGRWEVGEILYNFSVCVPGHVVNVLLDIDFLNVDITNVSYW